MRLNNDFSFKRSSGILMPIFSLCGKTGIGTLGQNAYSFIDLLKSAGQTYWQVLPLGTTGYGNSPYQSFSSKGGNPNFIDFDLLYKEGFLNKEDYSFLNWGNDEKTIDYPLVIKGRDAVLHKAFDNFKKKIPNDFYSFCESEKSWLSDFALFMAIKEKNKNVSLFSWENEKLRLHDKKSLLDFSKSNEDLIIYHKMLQFFFFSQWHSLKQYANANGVYIIGDIPVYVSSDSVEVWENPKNFCIDENYNIEYVAGCPPDAFSPKGQLWGNVLYNWDNIKNDDYFFWKDRLNFSLKMYDVIRIDHFRAFESYYSIPFSSKTAEKGQWIKGPDYDLFKSILKEKSNLPIIAEDLGFQTKEVKELLNLCNFSGMNVLQFAFDSSSDNQYLPHNLKKNSVIYTGTHDNDTLKGWIKSANAREVSFAKEYYRAKDDEGLFLEMLLSALSSVCDICILPLYDLLALGSNARINTPSTLQNNWQWRVSEKELKSIDTDKLLYFTKLYGRA